MIKLRVDDETAIPLSVDSSSAVSMTVSEAFIDRGGSAIQNNKNATPSTSQVVVTPDQGFDGMAKVTVAAMPQGEIDPASLSYDTHLLRGRITAEANVTQAGYVPIGGNVARAYCDELLPSENPKTVTPTTSEQTAVDANKWTKGQIKVGPIPPEYIVPTGTKSISANGTGIDVKAYEKVDVAVPGITPSGTLAIATNGSHDVTNYATASVAVPASAVDSGTKAITANGNGQDVVGYAAVNVNVPNSYAAADEGKVVSNGALVAQTSDTVTQNGTYDTTLKNEVVVDVQGGGGGGTNVETGSFTVTGAYIQSKSIVHSLNTTKIFGYIWVEPDENDQIVAPQGYTFLFGHFIAYSIPNEKFTGVTLVTNYTSSATKTAAYNPETQILFHNIRSNWSNAAASWGTENSGNMCWCEAVSDSEVTVKVRSNNCYMRQGLTYHYVLVSMEE